MNGRRISGWLAAALGLALAVPGAADAQVRIRVDWDFGNEHVYTSGTWTNGHVAARVPRIGVVHYQPVRYEPFYGVRIPRGFRPAPGFCRLWYPGVPPGHQPRPVPCEALYGNFHPDVLIVTWRGVMRPVWNQRLVAHLGNYWEVYAQAWDGRYLQDGYYRWDRYDQWYDGRRDRWDHRWDDNRMDRWWDDRYGDGWDDDDRWEDRRGDRWDRDDRFERDRGQNGQRNGARGSDGRGTGTGGP